MTGLKVFDRPAKALLLVVSAIPIAFALAILLRAEGDSSRGSSFAAIGVLGMVLSLAMAVVGRVRTKHMQKSWLLTLFANALVVFVGVGAIDVSGFADGGH